MPFKRVIVTKFGGPDVLELVEETELPEPGPGEARIRVLAAGVSFTDTLVRAGAYPDLKDKPPFTPGYDLVGVVDKLGEGASGVSVGDRVADLTVIGAYSEYVCVPASGLVLVPEGVDAADAASLILSGMTAYQLLHRKARIQEGQKVLIHGGGGAVGVPLLQLGQRMKLDMYATGSKSKHDLISSFGATPIDYRSEDFVTRIRDLTGDGVDAVFDGVGIPNFKRSFKCLKKGGKLVIYGASNMSLDSFGQKAGAAIGALQLCLMGLLSLSRSIDGYSIASRREKSPDWFKQDLAALFDLLARGELTPVIDRYVSLQDIPYAHELIERAKVQGKIVLKMGE